MRVLHVINQVSSHGGAEVSLRDIVTADTPDIEFGIVVLTRDRNDLTPFEIAGVPCFEPRGAPRGRWDQVAHVRRAVRQFAPDLVQTSLFDADLAGRVACFIEGVPVLTTFVNTPYAPEVGGAETTSEAKRRSVHAVDRLLARHATSGFHAISRATADHAIERLGISARTVRVVPRGRSRALLGERSSERRDRVRSELGWSSRPVVINVARQEPQKGQRYLIDAMRTVVAHRPDALLALVGRDGRSTPDLDLRIASTGLSEAVVRLGIRQDVADLVSAADVFAFPSLYEGLGGAAVEALGLGVPIVASDVPALREVAGDGRGWLVPPADADALAAAIVEVLEGGDEVAKRAARGREAFAADYELETCVQGMLGLYRDVGTQLANVRRRRFRRPKRLQLAAAPTISAR